MARMSMDTAIRLSAEVKGGSNITKVQRSLQDLAQGSKTTARDMATLRAATFQYARANDSTIGGIRNSITAFRGLQEQARIGSREFQRYGAEVQRLEGKLRGLDGTAAKAGESMGAKLATGLAAAGIGRALQGITMQAANYEGELRKAAAIEGGAGSMAVLRKEIEAVASVAAGTPTEVAALATSLSRAGFSAQETAQSLRGIVLGAEATDTAFDRMGGIASTVLNTFGMQASDTASVIDIMVKSANSANQTVEDLGEALSYSGSVASNLGVSVADLSGVIGLLADAGIRGSRAGTTLSTGLNRLQIAAGGGDSEMQELIKGSAKMTDAMERLGAAVLDTEGKFKPMDQVLIAIKRQMADFSNTDKAIMAKALFGEESGRGFLALLGRSEQEITAMIRGVNNAGGTAQETREKMRGFGDSLKVLGGNIENVTNQIGGMIGVALKPLIDTLNGAFGVMAKLPEPIKAIGSTAAAAGIATLGLVVAINALKAALAVVGGVKAVTAALTGYTGAATAAGAASAGATGKVAALTLALSTLAGIGIVTVGVSLVVKGMAELNDAIKEIERLRGLQGQGGIAGENPQGVTTGQRTTARQTLDSIRAERERMRGAAWREALIPGYTALFPGGARAGRERVLDLREQRAQAVLQQPGRADMPNPAGAAGGGAGSGSSKDAEKAAKDAAKAVDDAAKAQRDLAADQLQQQADLAKQRQELSDQLFRNEMELENARFKRKQDLVTQEYDHLMKVQQRALSVWTNGLLGPAQSAAQVLARFMSSIGEVGAELTRARVVVQDAKQALSQAERSQQQSLVSMAEGRRIEGISAQASAMRGSGEGGGSGVTGLLTAASKNLGLFAGQTERCADAIRKLFQEAGIAIGVTKKAWDGLGTGPRMASSFFGDDIGQRINRKEDLRAGDLVGFDRTYGSWGPGVQTHVGMYAGGGMMFDHSSRKGVVRRPLDTFGGKFMYGVRPNALAQGGNGTTSPTTNAPAYAGPVRDVAGEGSVALRREELKYAEENLKTLEARNKELAKFDAKDLEQGLTQPLRQQNQEMADQIDLTKLRNRLTMEGVRPEIIDGEMEKEKLYRDQNRTVAALKVGIAGITDPTRKADAEKALADLNAEYAKQVDLINQGTAAQLEQGVALGLYIGQMKQQMAELTNIENQIITMAGTIEQELSSAISASVSGLVTGATTVQQAMGEMFKNVGEAFMKMAADILAKQMVLTVLGIFGNAAAGSIGGGPTGSFGGGQTFGFNDAAPMPSFDMPSVFPRAMGGPAAARRPLKVGENGPELFVPYQAGTIIPADETERILIPGADSRRLPISGQGNAAANLSVPFQGGSQGLAVPFLRAGADGAAGSNAAADGGTIKFESVVIGNQEFVTRQEAEEIGRRSEARGAALAQKRIVNNPTVRRAAGLS